MFFQELLASFSCLSASSFLFSFVAFFVVFGDVFGNFFELVFPGFFSLIAFNRKRNAVLMQTGVRLFGRAKNKLHHRKARIIIRDDFLFRSFAIARF